MQSYKVSVLGSYFGRIMHLGYLRPQLGGDKSSKKQQQQRLHLGREAHSRSPAERQMPDLRRINLIYIIFYIDVVSQEWYF